MNLMSSGQVSISGPVRGEHVVQQWLLRATGSAEAVERASTPKYICYRTRASWNHLSHSQPQAEGQNQAQLLVFLFFFLSRQLPSECSEGDCVLEESCKTTVHCRVSTRLQVIWTHEGGRALWETCIPFHQESNNTISRASPMCQVLHSTVYPWNHI